MSPGRDLDKSINALLRSVLRNPAVYHDDMQKLKNYLLSFEHFRNPETEFDVSRLLFLMDRIALPLHTHLASVPQSLLALSRFSTPERPIDPLEIDRAIEVPDDNKTTNYVFNVLPAWLLNIETEEFEGGRWKDWPESKVKKLLTGMALLMNKGRWRFSSCDWRGRWRRGRS